MKFCKTCNIEKIESDFSDNRNHCKKCNRNKYQEKIKQGYFESNIIEKVCCSCNYTKPKSDFRTHRKSCKKCENIKDYRSRKNSNCISNTYEYKRHHQLKRKDKINISMKIYKKKRKHTDIIYRVSLIMCRIVGDAIRSYTKNRKSKGTIETIGLSHKDFINYIESKFEPWMNWENYGKYNGELNYGWDIDHIIPLSSAKSEEEVYKLNYYSNLQPLCSYTNRYIKVDKIIN